MGEHLMEWTFGRLGGKSNPLFINNTTCGAEGKTFELNGYGKIIQVSFKSNELHTEFKFKVDDEDWNIINNGYCLTSISDSRGLGYANIEKKDNGFYLYTFTLPIMFKENISVTICNKQTSAILKDLHIYYLKRWY